MLCFIYEWILKNVSKLVWGRLYEGVFYSPQNTVNELKELFLYLPSLEDPEVCEGLLPLPNLQNLWA